MNSNESASRKGTFRKVNLVKFVIKKIGLELREHFLVIDMFFFESILDDGGSEPPY